MAAGGWLDRGTGIPEVLAAITSTAVGPGKLLPYTVLAKTRSQRRPWRKSYRRAQWPLASGGTTSAATVSDLFKGYPLAEVL